MSRTPFPNDENGTVLRRIADRGVDLSVERVVEFAHRAPTRVSAERFAQLAKVRGFLVQIYEPDEESREEGDNDLDVICSRRMVPSHQGITVAENELAELAHTVGCREDGWGFME